MRKLLSLVLGFGMGAALGAALVVLFAPTSGQRLVQRLQHGWAETMEEARQASQQRRLELEAELARRRGDRRQPLP